MAPASKKKKRKPPPSHPTRTDASADTDPELAGPSTLNEQTHAEGRAADGGDKEKKKTKKKNNNVTPRTKARQYNTPLANTRATRNKRLRRKVLALVGRASCLVTGFMFDPQYLHIAHIVAHSLPWWLAEALLKDIGIRVFDMEGKFIKKILNLDTSVNQEILVAWIHLLFDGGIVSDGMDRGDIAFVPEEIDEMLDIIRENDGKKSYRELFPNFTYRYRLRCFSKNKYFYGRYAHAARSYDHMSPDKHKTPQQKEADDRELDDNHPAESTVESGEYHPPCAVDPKELPANTYKSNGECENRTMECGDQPDVFVSPMCPAFVIHNLCLKMQYRMKNDELRAQLPEEWCNHFDKKMWPATKQWYPTEAEAEAKKAADDANKKPGRQTENSNRDARQEAGNVPVPTNDLEPQAPLPHPGDAEPVRDDQPARGCPPSSPPGSDPMEPASSSPLGLGVNRRAQALAHSTTRPGERIPMLQVDLADAARDSSPAPPSMIIEGDEDTAGGAAFCSGAATMPDPARDTKSLPKRMGKTLTTRKKPAAGIGFALPSASHETREASSEPFATTSDKPHAHPYTSNADPSASAPVPKALDKARKDATKLGIHVSFAPAESTRPPNALSTPGPSTDLASAPKAPDKSAKSTWGSSTGPSPPAVSQRTTRSSTKRSREEAAAHDLKAAPQLPEPPKPPDPPEVQQKRRRTKPHEPDVEQDHDPPEPSRPKPRRGKRR
ncbi:hypothetical protein HDZ31DRAFT_37216 [Schizophyllum fasciatum]